MKKGTGHKGEFKSSGCVSEFICRSTFSSSLNGKGCAR